MSFARNTAVFLANVTFYKRYYDSALKKVQKWAFQDLWSEMTQSNYKQLLTTKAPAHPIWEPGPSTPV